MSLRTRTLLTIGLTAVLLMALMGLLFSQTLLRAFSEAELQDTERDVQHAQTFLEDELRAIGILNHDWASWDDTYAFIEDANPAYIRSNITDETFRNTHLNLMLFVHASGRVVFARAYDLEAEEEAPVPQGVYDALPVLTRATEEGLRNLLLLPEGVLLVTARPILTSEGRGPARGTLIFGRYLNSVTMGRIRTHLGLTVTAHRADRPEEWPDDLQVIYPELSPDSPIRARALDKSRIAGYGLMTDLYGRPALVLRTEGPREIYARGLLALRYLVGTVTALALLVALAAMLQLDRDVLARLASLAAQVRAIGAGGEIRGRVALRGRDELADLARAFNETLDALEQARREREEREAQLLRLAGNSPDVIYRLRLSPLRPEYISPAVTRILGYPPEAFYENWRLLYRIVHPEDKPLLRAALHGDVPPENPLILRWVNRNGETVWVEHRHIVVCNQAGAAIAVEGIARDITEQKRAEEELVHLNAILRAIRNINQAITHEKDRERLLQVTCDELVRARAYLGAWAILLGPDGRPEMGAATGISAKGFTALLDAWKSGEPPTCARQALAISEPLIIPEPEACPVCPLHLAYRGAAAMAVRLAYGDRAYGVLCVALPPEITPSPEEQRLLTEVTGDLAFALYSLEQEEALRESEERFRLLAEHSLTGIYLIQDGLLRYVNPAGAHMFGYEPEELIDRLSPLDVVVPEDRDRVTENIRKRLAGEVLSIRYTVQGLRKDGSRFPCEVLSTRVEYRGRPAILGTVMDLTDRVRAEEAVRRRAAQTEALRQVGLELFAQLDLDVLLSSIVQRAVDLVGGSAGGLYLYRPEEDALEWVVSIGPNQPPVGTRLRPSEEGISRKVWETCRPFWVDDYQQWEGRAARYADYPWTAVIGVPVRRGEEILGVLIVLADPPRTFSQEDADLLELFATQTAIALTNARLWAEAQQEREKLDFLHSLGQRLAGTLDAPTVAQEALEALCGMTGARQGVVYALDPDTSRLRLVAAFGHREAVEELDRRLQLQVGQGLSGWVALHRQTAIVEDVTRDDRWLVVRGLDKYVRSAVSVPLLFGEELVGVMSLGSPEKAAFASDHARLLEAAGAVLAGALLNARLYEAERERARRIAAVAELGERLTALLEPEAVYRETVEGVARSFGYDYVGLMLLDEAAGEVEFVAGAGIWAGRTPPGFRQKVTEGMIGWVARTGETLLANDVSQEPRYIAPYLTETRAELDVPLKYHGRLVGVLTIQSRQRDTFTPLDVTVMETLAGHVAAAITNAQLYQAQQRRSEELAILHQAAVTVSSQRELDAVLEALARQMGQALDVTSVYISLWDEKTHTSTQLKGWFGPQASEKEQAATLADVDQTFELGLHPKVVAALKERRPLVLHASGPLDPGDRAEVERYGWKSQLVVPLVVRDRAIGFVTLCESRRERVFTEAEIRLCQTLAADTASAIENAHLYEQERRARERTETLYRISQVVNSTLAPEVILDRLTEEAVRATGATHGSVLVPDPEQGVFERRSLRGYSPEEQERARAWPLGLTKGINGRAYQTRLAHYVPDVRQDRDYFPLIPTTRSELVIPLLRGDRVLGNLDLQSPQVDAFRNVDMEFLRALVDQVAIALENARLYEEERRRAQEQEVLALIATALNTLEVRNAFPILVHGLRTLTGCDRISVALLDEDGAHFRISILETPFPVLGVGTVQPLSATPVWDDVLGGKPHFCPDMSAEMEYTAIRALYDAGFRSYVSLPLRVGGRIIGVLHVVSLRERNFRQAQLRLLQQVADALAVAIENERLYRAEREQRELAQALTESAAVITRTLDPTQMLEQVIEQVARVVPGDAFNVMLVEDGNARVARWRGYERFGAKERVAAVVLPVAEFSNLWEMVQSGEPLLIPDTHADPRWVRLEGLEWVRSYVAAPIVIRGITVGFLNVDGNRPHQFSSADAVRLKAFADQVAIALENAYLYTELRQYAGTLEEQVRERTAQLAAQYTQLEAILRSTGDGIVLTDTQGEILQANLVAQNWLNRHLAPEDARRLRETIQRVALRARERAEEVVELPGLDLEVRASPVEGPEGEITAVVVLHDVTQYKMLERLRARFISNISHELRTPLTTLKTYLHLLRRMPELLPEYLDILEREVDWQARLVEDVLEISRLDSGAIRIQFGPVGLNALAAEVVDAQRPLALAQGLVLECRLAEKGPVARADPDALRIVLSNLVRNSIQYTLSGGRVEVSTGEEEGEGHRWATIAVADTGIGIPKDELPYIFDRFFRGDRPRQMQIPGTGLGLSIVKEIVDRYGGRIMVESEEGKGTRFTIWLPVAEEGPQSEGLFSP